MFQRFLHLGGPGVGLLLLFALGVQADEPTAEPTELLWPDGAPGAVGTEPTDQPGFWVYKPANRQAPGAAVVVCPGGGYGHLALGHEGHDVARWYNEHGVTAFVLRYRISPRYRHPAPLQDAQRAIRKVRAKADSYGVDPARIGIMGFSAGGHLASTAGTHFDAGASDAADPIDRVSCRPDFLVLGYPVISFTTDYTHVGSRRNLLGENPDKALVESLSNEKQVTAETPPTFMFHTSEDAGVPPENSILFYMALRRAKVPAELHIYEKGQHGVGLAPKDPILSSWPDRLADWLKARELTP